MGGGMAMWRPRTTRTKRDMLVPTRERNASTERESKGFSYRKVFSHNASTIFYFFFFERKYDFQGWLRRATKRATTPFASARTCKGVLIWCPGTQTLAPHPHIANDPKGHNHIES